MILDEFPLAVSVTPPSDHTSTHEVSPPPMKYDTLDSPLLPSCGVPVDMSCDDLEVLDVQVFFEFVSCLVRVFY